MRNEYSADWSSVAAKELNKPETKNQQGVKIQFMLSPADIPTAYRAYGLDGLFFVEFKYLGSTEQTKTLEEQKGVSLEVGKNSRRIYKITVDPAVLCRGQEADVEVEIKFAVSADNALKEMKKTGALNQGNADAIRRFLSPAFLGREHLFDQHSFGH